MLQKIKFLIQTLLTKLNIGIYYISDTQIDPLKHNSEKSLSQHYTDTYSNNKTLLLDRVGLFEEIVNLMEQRKISINDRTVCDAGCGIGSLLQLIKEKYKPSELIGLEYSSAAREIAKQVSPTARIETFDLYEEPKERFDILFCLETLEHLMYPEKALETSFRMANPGAHVILSVPDGRMDTFGGHINFWSPQSWKVFLESPNKHVSLETGLIKEDFSQVNWTIIKMP